MFSYIEFKEKIHTWKHKPFFWLIMIFIWPLFLLWWLGLWSVNDIQNRPKGTKIYKTKGLYGILIIALILFISAKAQSADNTQSTQPSSNETSSSSNNSTTDAPTTSETSDSEASTSSDAAKETSDIAASEAASNAAESSKKAASDAAKASSDAAKSASLAAEKDPNTYNTGISYEQVARTPDDYKGQKIQFTGKVVQVMEDDSETQVRLAVNGDIDNIILVGIDPDILNGSRILEDDLITVSGLSIGTVSYKSTLGGKITIPAMLAKIINDQGKASDDYGY